MVELTFLTLFTYWIPKFLMGLFMMVLIPALGLGFFIIWNLCDRAEQKVGDTFKGFR